MISSLYYSLSCWVVLWCSRKDELVWELLYRWLKTTEAPLSPLSVLPSFPLPSSFQPSSPPALPPIPPLASIPAISNPPIMAFVAASHLPFRLGAHSKCTSLGWVPAFYSMSEWSQLGHSLMNHFLEYTVRKSLSEFRARNRCSMKLICPLLSSPGSVVQPRTVCIHVSIQPVTYKHTNPVMPLYLGSIKTQTKLK